MEADKLEKFVINHSDEFDVFEPDDKIWDNIKSKTTPVRKINMKKIVWRVAAGITIFLASWLINDWVQKDKADQVVVAENHSENTANDNIQVLMEAEVYYTSKINSAREEINRLSGSDKNLINVLDYDLNELDEVFEELKNDLKDNSDNQEVIEAMIQNYRLKLQILEDILLQLNKKNKSDEKISDYEI